MEAPAEFVRAVRRCYRPERFVLIGSRARGNPLLESDWDFVVVSEAFRGQFAPDRVRGVRDCWPLDDDLDLLCLSPEEWRGEEARGISWIVAAARQGQDVLGSEPGNAGGGRPMREETRQWWALAEADQAAAEKLVGAGHFTSPCSWPTRRRRRRSRRHGSSASARTRPRPTSSSPWLAG